MDRSITTMVTLVGIIMLTLLVNGVVTGMVENLAEKSRSEVGFLNRQAAGALHVMTYEERYGWVDDTSIRDNGCGENVQGFGDGMLQLVFRDRPSGDCRISPRYIVFPLRLEKELSGGKNTVEAVVSYGQ